MSTTMDDPLLELLPRLAALPDDEIVRPHTDPHAAAATGLLIADWLGQASLTPLLPQVGLPPTAPRELARAARALLMLVDQLGGDYLSDTQSIPAELEERGHAVRLSTIKQLEESLSGNRDVEMWLEAIRLGSGVVDLVYDLRTLAELLTKHATALPSTLERLPQILRAASDAIEYALRADEAPDLALARGRLARVWTLFAPAYEYAAAAARKLTKEQGLERRFPPLAVVAAHTRARREPPQAKNPSLPPKPQAPPRETGSRRAHREVLELEVGIASESNFYVGFTENVSITGIFIATYVLQPIGSKVEIALTLPGGERLNVRGVVKWHRAAKDDSWPGVGVDFEGLLPEQAARIARFSQFREPLFFDG